jgi:hypothetical protein
MAGHGVSRTMKDPYETVFDRHKTSVDQSPGRGAACREGDALAAGAWRAPAGGHVSADGIVSARGGTRAPEERRPCLKHGHDRLCWFSRSDLSLTPEACTSPGESPRARWSSHIVCKASFPLHGIDARIH